MSGSADAAVLSEGVGAIPARGIASHPTTAALDVFELRAAMQSHLRKSGALQNLKTQLRGMVLSNLMRAQNQRQQQQRGEGGREGGGGGAAHSGGADESLSLEQFEAYRHDGVRAGAPAKSGGPFTSWSAHVADALIENHLRRTNRPMSLSLFSTEAEVMPLSSTGAPSDEEQSLRHLFSFTSADASAGLGGGGVLNSGLEQSADGVAASSSMRSVLQALVEHHMLGTAKAGGGDAEGISSHRHHCGVQTDDTAHAEGTNPLTSLECRLAAVDAKYTLSYAQLSRGGDVDSGGGGVRARAEVERRLEKFKLDMHEQLRAEYQQRYKAFEQTRLQEAKDAAEDRYRALVQIKQEELGELERSLVVRREQEQQRLHLARAELEQQRHGLERRQREMTEESLGREVEAQRQEEAQRTLKQRVAALQVQCSKWEELCGSRLLEAEDARSRESRRVEELRRMQAEHAAELRLKEEELSRLRFRIRMLVGQSNTTDPPTGASEAGSPSGQLYDMLVRTEELQRGAVLQQQHLLQQQQEYMRGSAQAWQRQPSPSPAPQVSAPPQVPAVAPAVVSPPSAVAAAAAAASDAHVQSLPSSKRRSSSSTVTVVESGGKPKSRDSPPSRGGDRSATPSQESSKSGPEVGKGSAASSSPPQEAAATAAGPSPSRASPLLSQVARLLSTSTTPQEGSLLSQRSESQSLLAIAAKVLKPAAASSLSSSFSSSLSSSSAATTAASREQQQQRSHSGGASTTQQSLTEEVANLVAAESGGRQVIGDEEESARAGLEWAANSQLAVIQSQEKSRREAEEESSRPSGGAPLRFLDQMATVSQQQALEQDNIIYRDDSDDGDSILFGGTHSTGSSF